MYKHLQPLVVLYVYVIAQCMHCKFGCSVSLLAVQISWLTVPRSAWHCSTAVRAASTWSYLDQWRNWVAKVATPTHYLQQHLATSKVHLLHSDAMHKITSAVQ